VQRTRVGQESKSIEGAQDKPEFASVNVQLGLASNLDNSDAQKDLLNARIDSVNAIIDSRIELARVEALIGGLDGAPHETPRPRPTDAANTPASE
jgi:outer membrane protein TolC